MKNINWKVRMKNKAFWVAIIPAVALLVQMVAQLFGFELKDINGISDQLVNIVNAVFVVLAILGVVVDSTTDGVKDSERTLNK